MKLILANYEYPPLGGGAGNATASIARALARQGHEVTVVTSAFEQLRGTQHVEPQLSILRLDCRRSHIDRSSYGEMLSYVWHAARALPQLARASEADGLIVFFSLPCGPLGWLTRRRVGTPYVISLRGGDVPGAEARVGTIHRLLASLRRTVLRNATAVVANSHGLARLSERADPTPVKVIANGVDTTFFSAAPTQPRSDATVRFLFAGRFQPQKNLFMLLEQFALASKHSMTPVHLTMIGDGAQRAELAAHSRSLGIEGMIEWPGWLDKNGLRDAYRSADVFLNPSLYEGMPNTVLEAMACSLPVIASRVIGNDELVRHNESGLLFDLAKPDALAAAMVELAAQPERRAHMGDAARAIASANYSWDATAAQYAHLFSRG
ncbi:MAG: glycosyltransferase family 4 protein [Dokdonella sp.]